MVCNTNAIHAHVYVRCVYARCDACMRDAMRVRCVCDACATRVRCVCDACAMRARCVPSTILRCSWASSHLPPSRPTQGAACCAARGFMVSYRSPPGQLYTCTFLHICTVARLHSCTLAHFYSCTAAQLHSCTVTQLHTCILALAYLHTCTLALAHLHTCTLVHLQTCKLAYLHTSILAGAVAQHPATFYIQPRDRYGNVTSEACRAFKVCVRCMHMHLHMRSQIHIHRHI